MGWYWNTDWPLWKDEPSPKSNWNDKSIDVYNPFLPILFASSLNCSIVLPFCNKPNCPFGILLYKLLTLLIVFSGSAYSAIICVSITAFCVSSAFSINVDSMKFDFFCRRRRVIWFNTCTFWLAANFWYHALFSSLNKSKFVRNSSVASSMLSIISSLFRLALPIIWSLFPLALSIIWSLFPLALSIIWSLFPLALSIMSSLASSILLRVVARLISSSEQPSQAVREHIRWHYTYFLTTHCTVVF